MVNKDKDKEHSNTGAMREGADATHDACHTSWERAATLDRMVAEAITRETSRITATFIVILNERTAVNLPETLKVTSGAAGFKTMTPFDWTRNKAIYH